MNSVLSASLPAATIDTAKRVTCAGCGLLCDDIIAASGPSNGAAVDTHGCTKGMAFFKQAIDSTASPRLNGKETDLQSAIRAASDILANSRQPLFAGLGTDVQGMRSILELAEVSGATLDHMASDAGMRNTLAMQNSGWQLATLTEVRNRADLLLIIGTDVVTRFPRFFERMVWNGHSMFDQDTAAREIVYLGDNRNTAAGISPRGIRPTLLPCSSSDLPDVLAALLALVSGRDLYSQDIAGIPLADLQHLATRLAKASYGVVVWAAADLDFPHAELAVEKIGEIIAKLNQTTRAAGLPLAGTNGDVTANQVSTWISGFPVRNSFRCGYPEYDPYCFSASRQLDEREADALVWASSLYPDHLPPANTLPTIVIGHPAMKFASEPDVFIPVGVPGVHHSGTMFRTDSVVSLPLHKLRSSPLPTVAEVFADIRAALGNSHAD